MPDDAAPLGPEQAAAPAVEAPWVEPLDVLAGFADEPYAGLLLSGAAGWSYLVRSPDLVVEPMAGQPIPDLTELLSTGAAVVGLAGYELSARLENSAPQARGDWPDLVLARYPAILAFHPASKRALAIGPDADRALGWLDTPARRARRVGALAAEVACETPDASHAAAVAETVARIAAGEIFQANLARPWRGRLDVGAAPFDLFARLARKSPAPYAAYWRLPGRALVSNSPERFLSVRGEVVETHPIKGTRPRGADLSADAALARELLASEKDRAENLMIVDLMRNDLSRVCRPGTVEVPRLAALESYANVHHLVSHVRGRLQAGKTAWDAFLAAFPPGSVTGAPKLQAMRVIAGHEPPRGPYCGSLFWAGGDGALEASVLIRTVALDEDADGWRFEARAGGGIVADSDPDAEVAETSAKISAILAALTAA